MHSIVFRNPYVMLEIGLYAEMRTKTKRPVDRPNGVPSRVTRVDNTRYPIISTLHVCWAPRKLKPEKSFQAETFSHTI